MSRAAIYARYSSDLQSSASIDDQIRICRERLEADRHDLMEAYTDYAISGGSMKGRAGMQALLEDAQRGKFDLVISEALDRVSRDQEDIAAIFKRLSHADVKLVTLAEGEISELHIGLKGTMNALFLKDLADKTRRGLRGRVEAGRSGGGNSYGYDVVRKIGPNGEAETGERVINQDQAAIIRRVFADYAAGVSPRSIAVALNSDGVPGPSGKGWGASTIQGNPKRGTGLLNNELYIGRMVWNRLRYLKDPDTGKRVSRPNPESEWVVQDVPDLRIIDKDLWDSVKTRQADTRRPTRPDRAGPEFWTAKRPRHLLSGLMTCGVCGGGIIQVGKDYLGCANNRNKGTCDNKKSVRRDRLEEVVLEGLKESLVTPELTETFCRGFVRTMNRMRSERAGKSERLRQDLRDVEREIEGIITAIKAGAFTASMTDELHRLEAEKDRLKREAKAKASNQDPVRLHPGLATVYAEKVANLADCLNAPESKAGAVTILRGLIDAIDLTPSKNGKSTDVRLKGDLATLLGFAAANESSTKLVAGVGFEPTTFRL